MAAHSAFLTAMAEPGAGESDADTEKYIEGEAEPEFLPLALAHAAITLPFRIPYRIATSRRVHRAIFNTILLSSTAIFFAAVTSIAYILFYRYYIPDLAFSRPIYLQFDTYSASATGNTTLRPPEAVAASRLDYDVALLLRMPRTPSNIAEGNFMLDLALHGPAPVDATDAAKAKNTKPGTTAALSSQLGPLLTRSSRPACLTYYSPYVEMMHKAASLPWYLLGWRQEVETLRVPMLERVRFARGYKNVPALARLSVPRRERLQVYAVSLEFTARFAGLRYLMYHYRLLSFVFFTFCFWASAMFGTILLYIGLKLYYGNGDESVTDFDPDAKPIKHEYGTDNSEIEMSDTDRAFPTYTTQPPLMYTAPRVKKEEDDGEELPDLAPTMAEADDEDEDADFVLDDPSLGLLGRADRERDSGIGTSMESGTERDGLVRRRSLKSVRRAG